MTQPTRSVSSTRQVRLRVAAGLYFGARLLLVMLLVAAPLLYWWLGWQDPLLAVVGGGVVMLSFVVAYLVALPLRCVVCSQPVLLHSGQPRHAYAGKWLGLSYRAKVAWDVLTAQHHHCMYCHTQCRNQAHRNHGTNPMAFRPAEVSKEQDGPGMSAFSLPPLPSAPLAAPMATIFDPALLSESGRPGWAPASSGPADTLNNVLEPLAVPSFAPPTAEPPGSPWLAAGRPVQSSSSPFTVVAAMPATPTSLPPGPAHSVSLPPPPAPSPFPFQDALAAMQGSSPVMGSAGNTSPFQVVVPSVFDKTAHQTAATPTPFAPLPSPVTAPGPQGFGSGSVAKESYNPFEALPPPPASFAAPVSPVLAPPMAFPPSPAPEIPPPPAAFAPTPLPLPPLAFPSPVTVPVPPPPLEIASSQIATGVLPAPPAVPPHLSQLAQPPAGPSKPSSSQPSPFFGAARPPAALAPLTLGPVGNAGMLPFNLPISPFLSKPPPIRTKPPTLALPMELTLPSQTPAPPALAPKARPPKLLISPEAVSPSSTSPAPSVEALIQILQKGQNTLATTFESMIQELRLTLNSNTPGAAPGPGSNAADFSAVTSPPATAGQTEAVSKWAQPPLPSDIPVAAPPETELPSPPQMQQAASPPALTPLAPLPPAPFTVPASVPQPAQPIPVVQNVPPAPEPPAYPPLYPLDAAAPVPTSPPVSSVWESSAPDLLPSPRRRPLPLAMSADLKAELGSTLAQAFTPLPLPPPPPPVGYAQGVMGKLAQPSAPNPFTAPVAQAAPAAPAFESPFQAVFPQVPASVLLPPPNASPELPAPPQTSAPVAPSPFANAAFQIPNLPQNTFAPAPATPEGATPSATEEPSPGVPAPFSFLQPVGDPWVSHDLSSPPPMESPPMWTRSGGKTSLS